MGRDSIEKVPKIFTETFMKERTFHSLMVSVPEGVASRFEDSCLACFYYVEKDTLKVNRKKVFIVCMQILAVKMLRKQAYFMQFMKIKLQIILRSRYDELLCFYAYLSST